jgi:LysR family transcriptional regulator, transcriptional activator for bauABCD operon
MKVISATRARAILGQVSDVDLRLLRVFKAVVECGGMAAAELELNIGTSTVSRHMKDLEIRLGLKLCRRGRGGFSLTPEGDRVYREILQLLGSVETFRTSIDDIHRRMAGELQIALFDKTATNPEARIHAAIARFAARAPDVRLSLHVDSINGIERGLIGGTYHFGVMPTHRSSKALSYMDLFGEAMLLYCARRHPLFEVGNKLLTWAQVRRMRFAGLGYHSPNMELSHRERLERAATGYDQEAIATLVLSGEYLGFLPDHYADHFVRAGLLRAVHPERFKYSCRFAGVVRRSPEPSRVVQAFAECLLDAHGLTPAPVPRARVGGSEIKSRAHRAGARTTPGSRRRSSKSGAAESRGLP